jgi:Amt family ammonium transporter
VLQLI